ncbi:MAG: TerD family protein [Clostridiales bacterium]|nr:TerD family protein [Clostridiales bacterium]
MSVTLTKGQKISLSKEVEGLSKVVVGLGWDAAKKGIFGSTYDIDCDASVILLGLGDTYKGLVYYGEKKGANGCVLHHGDNLTGDGDGDDEQITVDLKGMPENIERVVFVVNIYQADKRNQHFGMIRNAYIRLVNKSTGKEICKYNLSEKYDDKTAMIFGEAYRKNGEWKFNALGQATNDVCISQLVRRYN